MALRPDIARRTLKVKVNNVNISNRDGLIKILKENFEELSILESVVAVYKCSDSSRDWYVTFSSHDLVDVFCTSEGRKDNRGGAEFIFDRLDRRIIRMRVHWYPMHYASDPVESYLERFGTIRKFEYDSQLLESGLSIQTGVINVEIVSTEHLVATVPYTESINGKKVLFTVVGRPSLCLRCNEVGHSRAKCPKKEKTTTVKTYADAASRVDPPAGQVRQEGAESSAGQVRQSDLDGVGSAGQVRQSPTMEIVQITDSLAGQVRQESSSSPISDEVWKTVKHGRKRKGSLTTEEDLDVKDSRIGMFLDESPTVL